MPRPTRRSKSRRAKHGEEMEQHLLTGHCLMSLIDPDYFTDDEVKEAWQELKGALLPDFVRQNPGHRPWAWWHIEMAGKRRERVDGGVHPHDNKARTLHVANSDSRHMGERAYALTWGYPAVHLMPFDSGLKTEMFEADWEFIVRHDALIPEDSP